MTQGLTPPLGLIVGPKILLIATLLTHPCTRLELEGHQGASEPAPRPLTPFHFTLSFCLSVSPLLRGERGTLRQLGDKGDEQTWTWTSWKLKGETGRRGSLTRSLGALFSSSLLLLLLLLLPSALELGVGRDSGGSEKFNGLNDSSASFKARPSRRQGRLIAVEEWSASSPSAYNETACMSMICRDGHSR